MSSSSMRDAYRRLTPGKQATVKTVLGAALGGVLGLGYYALIGCATGACPLAANPVITVGMGVAVGAMMARG